jgi:transcription elongation factor Elf1
MSGRKKKKTETISLRLGRIIMNNMKLKILHPSLRNNKKCFFCGSKKSVRYILDIGKDGEEKEVICCNICALLHYPKE